MKTPAKIIPLNDAKQMYDTYNTRRIPIIETYEKNNGNAPNFQAVRYGEWTFAELKDYVNYLEFVDQKLKDSSPVNKGIDGVRIYFGAYPNDTHLSSGKQIPIEEGVPYSGRSTFFFIPTLRNGADQTPFALEKDTFNPSLLNNDLTRRQPNGNIDSLTMNEANLVPPPYPDPE